MLSFYYHFYSYSRLLHKRWSHFLLKKTGFFLPLALLCGCASAPPPGPSTLALPAAYKEAAAYASLWQQAPAPTAVPAQWWQLFADPVLDQLQAQAQQDSPSLAQSLARWQAAQAALGTAEAARLPTLGASASGQRAHSASSGSSGSSASPQAATSNSYSLGLNASWELDLWGRLSASAAAAQASAEASRADLAAAQLSLQAQLVQSYFSLRNSEAQAQLLAQTIDSYERSWQLTRNRQRAGLVSSADVAQAEAQYRSAQAQLLSTQASRAQWEHALAALVGQAPAAFSLAPSAELPAPPAVPPLLPAGLLQARPDIAAAQQRVAAANAQIGVAQAAFFPALTLSGQLGQRSSTWAQVFDAPSRFWSLGPALALTLFDGGARAASVASARASQAQAEASYRQVVLTALQEVEDNLSAASALAQQQQRQQQALVAAQQALQVAQNQYRAGTVAYLNVLSAQTQVLTTERSLLDVRNQRLVAVGTLLKNLGGQWPQASNPAELPSGAAAP
ncbi:efflux transporter outer membrane subunit [Acidovorax sp. HDW3]|nr:efflux transporter outer membrane subunit [Acidovorax sp. HDW3]